MTRRLKSHLPDAKQFVSPARNHRPRVFRQPLALLVPALLGLPSNAGAQTPLPPIVVESTTIAAAPAKPRPAAPSAGAAAGSASTSSGDAPAQPPPSGVDFGAGPGRGVSLDTVGSAVTVVTGEELRQQQVRNASDALRSLPGVAVNQAGAITAQTQIRIRGAEGNHTLVLIDGVEANTGSTAEFDFSNLSAAEIERIEVVRGPQSGLYGSGAIGGVVNIVTRDGKGPAKATLTTELGSFGTERLGVSLSGGNDRAHGIIAYDALRTNGFNIAPIGDEADQAQRRSFLFKGTIRPIDTLAIDMMVRHVDKQGDRDGDKSCPFPAPPSCKGLSVQVDTPSFFASRMTLAGIEARLDQLGGRLTHKLYANMNRTELEDTDVSTFGSFFARNDNERYRTGFASTYRFELPMMTAAKHTVTALIEHETERFNPVTADDVWRTREHVAFAAEHRAELWNRVFLASTVRRDEKVQVEDPLGKAGDVPGFTTWRSSVSVKIAELGLRPHASIGTGVKLPTMFETFGVLPALFEANPHLKPETARGWDVGIERSFLHGRVVLDATYFRQTLNDEIETYFEFDCTPASCRFLSKVRNRDGLSERQGVELSARWKPTAQLMLGAAYTYLDATEPDGQREIRRPPHSARVDASLGFGDGRGRLTVAAAYNGKTDDIAFGLPGFTPTRVTLGDYWLVTAAASWRLAPGVELFGRVENLLDAKYQEVHGFATPGLAAYGGLKLTFGGETVAGRK